MDRRTGSIFAAAARPGAFLALTCGALSIVQAVAQNYPSRPVRIIVPYLSGGAGDSISRTLAQKLAESLGQPFYIDNRPGAATQIGTELAARSAPNGYTLLMASPASAINVSLYPKLPYDLAQDFAPVTLIDISPNVLVVHPSLPVNSVKQLIALAKSRPGQLNFASSGIAGSVHFAGELFKFMAGIDIVHIPYKGFAQALTDLLNGRVSMSISTMTSALPQVKAGRLRALAVTGAQRSASAPELPTVSEAGVPGYEIVTWHGLLAPAATPQEIILKLNGEIIKVLKLPETRGNMESVGMELVGSSPAELAVHIKTEIAKYAQLVKHAGIRAE